MPRWWQCNTRPGEGLLQTTAVLIAVKVDPLDQQVDDEHLHRVGGRWVEDDFEIDGAAAAGDHARMKAVGQIEDLIFAALEDLSRFARIRDIDELDLADENGFVTRGGKASRSSGRFRGEAEGGDDGGFFHGERHDVVLAVDHEVDAEAHRQPHDADDVFYHVVGVVHIENRIAVEQGLVVMR